MTDAAGAYTTTFGNEDGLPRVPLPTVEETCRRFVEWCTPLLTAGELAQTREAVEAFQRPEGPADALQAELARYGAGEDVHSWLDRSWPERYLGRRDRIAVDTNFAFLLADSDVGQLERAATLVAAVAGYKLSLDAERVPPAVQRDRPLSMAQARSLFSVTRIPGVEQDTVRAPYTTAWPGPSRHRHVVVFCRGGIFRLDAVDPSGQAYDSADLVAALRSVIEAVGGGAGLDESVAHLTTSRRPDWAASRRALCALDPRNAAALDTIETALFCLSLDDREPATDTEACAQLLHGDSADRWFDKALSFVVFRDGSAGLNVEHSGLDGTTVLELVDAVRDPSPGGDGGSAAGPPPEAVRVTFVLDDALRRDVRDAADAFHAHAAGTATQALSFDGFGSDQIKRLGTSPDGFVQMAFQLAHHRAKGRTASTYESIAVRHFRGGRTAAMRVVTPEVLRFVAAMDDPDGDAGTRRAALREAAAAHAERAKDCQQRLAPEQHLHELRRIWERGDVRGGGQGPLALFDSPGWRVLRDEWLSTSSAPSPNVRYFCFGPTGPHCIGVGYVLLADRFTVHLSTPRPVADGLDLFAARLREAVPQLCDLLASP